MHSKGQLAKVEMTANSPDRTMRRPPFRREAELIQAATDAFYQTGYADSSMQQIAQRLGILKGSIYHYIASKEDLLFRILSDVHDELDELLANLATNSCPAPTQRLHAYFEAIATYNLGHLPQITVYYQNVHCLGQARRSEIVARRALHEDYVTQLIATAQQRGEVASTVDPHTLSSFAFGAVIWSYRWYHVDGRLAPSEMAAAMADFVTAGIRGGQS